MGVSENTLPDDTIRNLMAIWSYMDYQCLSWFVNAYHHFPNWKTNGLVGKSTGNHGFYMFLPWNLMGFPVHFPLNQSNWENHGFFHWAIPRFLNVQLDHPEDDPQSWDRSNDWTERSPLRGDSWRLVGGFHDHLMTQVIWIVMYKL